MALLGLNELKENISWGDLFLTYTRLIDLSVGVIAFTSVEELMSADFWKSFHLMEI